ncbi:MAG: Arc family DNA-binding protein [Bacillota bacterium]
MERKTDRDRKQILLRLSPTLWKELAAWAEDDFRSINGQIEYLLTECVRRRRNPRLSAEDGEPDRGQSPPRP